MTFQNIQAFFQLKEFNAKVHRPFSCYEHIEIIKALESKYDMSNLPNLPLVRFYPDWLDAQFNRSIFEHF